MQCDVLKKYILYKNLLDLLFFKSVFGEKPTYIIFVKISLNLIRNKTYDVVRYPNLVPNSCNISHAISILFLVIPKALITESLE